MEKNWFIIIAGKEEGPYSIAELMRDTRITPDTLVWREGFKNWMPAKQVKELRVLFKDAPDSDEEESETQKKDVGQQSEIVLEMNQPPPLFWLFVALIILLYVFLQLYWKV